MMITETRWVTVLQLRIDHTLSNGIFGYFFVVRSLLFFFFARHANGLMIIDRKNSGIFWIHLFIEWHMTVFRPSRLA